MKNKFANKLSGFKISFKYKLIFVIIILVGIYVIFALTRPMPVLTATAEAISSPTLTGNFSWPSYGESAVGAQGYGLLAHQNEQASKPIASIAKTILTLAVLKEKPLNLDEQGPTITITQGDIDIYKNIVSQNGSNIPIAIGENLTEYQALQAILIASADNVAETLAIWAFGSIDNYLAYANKMVADMGLAETHIADASGLSAQTVSSAKNLIIIGEKFLENPVLAQIANQLEAGLPVAGKVKNYNTLLGENGVIGIKTGTTPEAGGCLLFAYTSQINSKDSIIIGAIMGASTRYAVLNDTINFIKNNANNFKYEEILKENQVVGSITLPWGNKVNVVTQKSYSLLMVPGLKPEINISFNQIDKPQIKGYSVGTIDIKYNNQIVSIPAVLETSITNSPFWWKLLHTFN